MAAIRFQASLSSPARAMCLHGQANGGSAGPAMESEAEGQAQGCIDLAHSPRRHDAGPLHLSLAAA